MNDDLKALRTALEPSKVFWVLEGWVGEEEALMKIYRAIRRDGWNPATFIVRVIQPYPHGVSSWFVWSNTEEGRDFWNDVNEEVRRVGDEIIGGTEIPV